MGERVFDHAFGAFQEPVFPDVEPASHNLRRGLHFSGQFIDSDNGQHNAVFADVSAVFDDEIFDYVGAAAGIDADAADINASGFAGAQFVEFENVSAFDPHNFAHGAFHGSGHLGVQ